MLRKDMAVSKRDSILAPTAVLTLFMGSLFSA